MAMGPENDFDESGNRVEPGVPPQESIPGFKVVMIGEPQCGKTSIFLRYIKNQFDYNYKPTKKAVVSNVVKKVNLPNDLIASVTLWDLPGREDIDLRETYYRNVDAAIVVVDMTDDASIELAAAWKQEFLNRVSRVKLVTTTTEEGAEVTHLEKMPFDPKKIPVLLLGNKYDLIEEKLHIDKIQTSILNPVESELIDIETMQTDQPAEEPVKESKGKGQGKRSRPLPNPSPPAENPIEPPNEDVEAEEECDEEDDVAFSAQRGPKKHEPKPECVKLLEKVENEHGFIGSVMVSCKDNDNSVYGAIQSLVRYLLGKVYPDQPKKMKKKPKKKKVTVAPKQFFRETGSEMLDKIFSRCNPIGNRMEEFVDCYNLAWEHFKQVCDEDGFLGDSNVSLEDVVTGFRDSFQDFGLDLKVADDEEGFLNLFVEENPSLKMMKEMQEALNVFNNEYVPICHAILRDCPAMIQFLLKLDGSIEKKIKGMMEEGAQSETERINLDRIIDVTDNNRAKVWFVKSQTEELLKKVHSAESKIKAVFLW